MKQSQAPFIILEGLDGSGTTTQAQLLTTRLRAAGKAVFRTCEPTDGPAGKLIRDILSGKLYSPGSNEKVVLMEPTLCLLFAADRLDHTAQIESARRKGQVVICDRYILSSLAYQTLDPAITPEWVMEVNRGCAVPDVTLLLKVTAAECAKRLRRRKELPTIYEKQTTLTAIDRNYDAMVRPYQERFGPVITVDGAGAPEKILDDIMAAIAPLLLRG